MNGGSFSWVSFVWQCLLWMAVHSAVHFKQVAQDAVPVFSSQKVWYQWCPLRMHEVSTVKLFMLGAVTAFHWRNLAHTSQTEILSVKYTWIEGMPSVNTCTNLILCPVNWIPFLCGCVQDVARLYKQQQEKVRVTLVESNQILSSFDDRLRSYAEKKITQRKRFSIVHSSVTGEELCQRASPPSDHCIVCVQYGWQDGGGSW